jgi:cellulose synthase/poly-beta-1,6-N-acetylglucosamine synthase-like glycosyltransferase
MDADRSPRNRQESHSPADATPPVRVSVIVPYFGPPDGLTSCLLALRASSHDAFEVIPVDDGSRIAIEGVPNLVRLDRRSGPAAARNAGAAWACGGILVFIDADVVVNPDTVARFEGTLDVTGADAVQACYTYPGGGANAATRFLEDFQEYKADGIRGDAIGTLRGGCFAVRAELFRSVGGFDERFTEPSQEDTDLGWRIAKTGATIRLDRSNRVKHVRPVPGYLSLWGRYLRLFRSMIQLHLRAGLARQRGAVREPGPTNTMSRADQTWRPTASVASLFGVLGATVTAAAFGASAIVFCSLIALFTAIYLCVNIPFLAFVRRHRRPAELPGAILALVGFHGSLLVAILTAPFDFVWERY